LKNNHISTCLPEPRVSQEQVK